MPFEPRVADVLTIKRLIRSRMDNQCDGRDRGRIRIRMLRVLWSATWGIVCVMLIAMWLRSYWSCDLLRRNSLKSGFEIISVEGRLKLTHSAGPAKWIANPPNTLTYSMDELEAATLLQHVRRFANAWGFGIERGPISAVLVPHWFVATLAGVIAAVPWIIRFRRRFSLRTLLIAMTLIAVGLGAIVYAFK